MQLSMCGLCLLLLHSLDKVRAVSILIFFNQHECEATSELLTYQTLGWYYSLYLWYTNIFSAVRRLD